jgi:ribosome-binding protein aMBF1 (putative translation factor)
MKTLERSHPSRPTSKPKIKFEEQKKTLAYAQDGLKVDLSEEVWKGMKAKGLSQADLARKIGKSRAYVTKILKGTTNFTVDTAAALLWAVDRRLALNITPQPQNTASRPARAFPNS